MILFVNIVVLSLPFQGLLKAGIRMGDHDAGLSSAPLFITAVALLGAPASLYIAATLLVFMDTLTENSVKSHP